MTNNLLIQVPNTCKECRFEDTYFFECRLFNTRLLETRERVPECLQAETKEAPCAEQLTQK